jgi:hypothetical protein
MACVLLSICSMVIGPGWCSANIYGWSFPGDSGCRIGIGQRQKKQRRNFTCPSVSNSLGVANNFSVFLRGRFHAIAHSSSCRLLCSYIRGNLQPRHRVAWALCVRAAGRKPPAKVPTEIIFCSRAWPTCSDRPTGRARAPALIGWNHYFGPRDFFPAI